LFPNAQATRCWRQAWTCGWCAYCLALEHGCAGEPYYAVAEEGIRARRIAGVVAAGLDVPERSIKQEEAAAMFVWFALFAGMDLPASSALTRQRLGWQPMARRCCRICRRWTTARGA